jgi:hypothetical protein
MVGSCTWLTNAAGQYDSPPGDFHPPIEQSWLLQHGVSEEAKCGT